MNTRRACGDHRNRDGARSGLYRKSQHSEVLLALHRDRWQTFAEASEIDGSQGSEARDTCLRCLLPFQKSVQAQSLGLNRTSLYDQNVLPLPFRSLHISIESHSDAPPHSLRWKITTQTS